MKHWVADSEGIQQVQGVMSDRKIQKERTRDKSWITSIVQLHQPPWMSNKAKLKRDYTMKLHNFMKSAWLLPLESEIKD